MTISEIIENNESNMEELENLSHVPQEVKSEIDQKYNEINELLEKTIDECGDEDGDIDEDETDLI